MGRKKTPEVDTQATREKIIETAERIFKEVGYAKTTVGDIAASLGMSHSNVYRYFPTKAHINEEICDRLVRGIEAMCLPSADKGNSTKENLTRFILHYHRSIRERVFKGNKLYDMVSLAIQQHWPVIQGHSVRLRRILESILDKGVASGQLKKMDTFKMARAIHEAIAVFVHPDLIARWVEEFGISGHENGVEEQLIYLAEAIIDGISLESAP